MVTPEDVLDTWFGTLRPDGTAEPDVASRWWRKDPAFDAALRERFGAALEAASRGALEAWQETPRGSVALVILLDQLSRNIHRDTPGAFANDARALAVTRHLIDSGQFEALGDLERYFALMPTMHSEDLDVHALGAEWFGRARDAARSEGTRQAFEMALDFHERHTAILRRFGRYPHRNAILGRPSTEDELAFLEQPGSSF
jgi:uncharacterized protein (DUF924 family)